MATLLSAHDLSLFYEIRGGLFNKVKLKVQAVNQVSFSIKEEALLELLGNLVVVKLL